MLQANVCLFERYIHFFACDSMLSHAAFGVVFSDFEISENLSGKGH